MKVDLSALDGIVATAEMDEVTEILGADNVIGFAILDSDGAPVEANGVSETAVAVFSNIFDQAEKIGTELGETPPRPAIMFSGSDLELVALPLSHASVIVVKEKGAGIRREFRRAS
ncbi:MAG: hypothetical protein AAGB18_02170 [Pseudomonadota bacterium]